ncbi:Vesicle-associated membrane protein [Spraguea lophii 42_110]|uniref:Vesicle-associated membrane protein n=1 Tax=Spraguea lophii (strain 42_110) TaxID=1358809 RepID=S7W6Y5_SPRLO|nr:Vesicle-associated membrane protein [Spraguea lophii 42_110]
MISSQISISDKIIIDPTTKKGNIIIHNRGLTGCAYKIKTTNPKGYTVKPSIDIIPPLENATVIILLNDKINNDDKFMIEVYEVDWRDKNLDLKTSLGKERAPIILSKKLMVVIKHQPAHNVHSDIHSLIDGVMLVSIFIKMMGIFKALVFE